MKKLSLVCLGALLLTALMAGCSKPDAAEEGPKPGEVKVMGGGQAPPPEAAATATRPQNPFEAAGVGGPGMKKGKGGGGAPPAPGGQ